MNMEILYALCDIDDSFIEEAAPHKKKKTWKIWAGIAACLCITTLLSALFIHTGLYKNISDKYFTDNHHLDAIQMIEYNDAYFEVIESKALLHKVGLPDTITDDMAGEHIAYLKGQDYYTVSESPTDIELFTYSPILCDAVKIIRKGDTYSAAVFCNYISSDGDVRMDISELYRLYGIYDASDIASISKAETGREGYSSRVIAPAAIREFYDITTSFEAYSNSEYQAAVFGGKSEEEQHELSINMADKMCYLHILTKQGLKFRINIYPEHGWMYSALTSYRMSDAMFDWYAKNIG